MAIIDKPSDYFNTKLYTGTGSELANTGVGFQPDWTWIKDRDTASNHMVTDAVRGATKTLYIQNADGESTVAQALKSFNTDGFTVGTDGDVNANTKNFASWNWLANGSGSSNGTGSITATVSANTTSGFSIVSYTGTGSNATVGHGLGSVPKMMIVKRRSGDTEHWVTYHQALGATNAVYLNLTNASGASTPLWNDTAPTSSVFTVGTGSGVNANGSPLIAYCFADTSMSKMGSYTGNGNADGTFVYTGFKPAFVIVKRSDGVDDWVTFDNKRNGFNGNNTFLKPNTGEADSSVTTYIDLLSNGFKPRNSWGSLNTSGGAYIFMAFAENPFVTSTANGSIPATAR